MNNATIPSSVAPFEYERSGEAFLITIARTQKDTKSYRFSIDIMNLGTQELFKGTYAILIKNLRDNFNFWQLDLEKTLKDEAIRRIDCRALYLDDLAELEKNPLLPQADLNWTR